MRERAVPGAKIIQRNPHPLVLQAADNRLRERQIFEQRDFSEFQFKAAGGKARFGQHLQDFLGEPGVFQLER